MFIAGSASNFLCNEMLESLTYLAAMFSVHKASFGFKAGYSCKHIMSYKESMIQIYEVFSLFCNSF